VSVGFAAESNNLLENAKAKLRAKKLDLIVANDITAEGSGFAVDTNQVSILDTSGAVQALPKMTKSEVAKIVIERVIGLLADAK
jgi:phosphopantothenoylcysteine decarboxylase / phosphopantothenate---cysteine ligase